MLDHLSSSPVKPSRVLVMGAGGFVGSALCRLLEKSDIPFLPLTRLDVDLLDDDASEKLIDIIRPGDSFVAVSALAPATDADMLIQNMNIARSMISALLARENDLSHVINISSDAVFADTPTPITEASCTAPNSYHGVMHLAREVMFKTEVHVPLATLRPTLIYGAKDPHNGYGPNRFRRLIQENENIVLFGEGEELRDHVHINDVAEIIYLSLMHRSKGELNVATGHVISFRELAELTVSCSSSSASVTGSPRHGPMPHNGFRPFDISACQAAFPEFRYTPIQEGIELSLKESRL